MLTHACCIHHCIDVYDDAGIILNNNKKTKKTNNNNNNKVNDNNSASWACQMPDRQVCGVKDFTLPDRWLHAMHASCCHSFVNASALVTGWHERCCLLKTLHMQHPVPRCNHLDCRTCLTPEEDTYLMNRWLNMDDLSCRMQVSDPRARHACCNDNNNNHYQ